MTISLRTRVGDVWVLLEQHDDGRRKIEVTDTLSQPVTGPEREKALEAAMAEISKMRNYIWKVELKR